jgi:nucleotide-binding universal stress UspA family protein
MNKILVPVDFSEHSKYALQVAITLAKKQITMFMKLVPTQLPPLPMAGADWHIFSKEA